MSQSFFHNTSSVDDSAMNITNCEPERVKLYRNIVHETLQNVYSSISVDEFVGFFKNVPLTKKPESVMPTIYEMINKYVVTQVMEQVDEHIRGSNFSSQCAELDKIIKDNVAYKGTKAWRPSRNVNETLRSYRMEQKREMKEQLERMVLEKEKSVTRLKHEVDSVRSTLKQITENASRTQQILDNVNQNIDKCMTVSKEVENMKQFFKSSDDF